MRFSSFAPTVWLLYLSFRDFIRIKRVSCTFINLLFKSQNTNSCLMQITIEVAIEKISLKALQQKPFRLPLHDKCYLKITFDNGCSSLLYSAEYHLWFQWHWVNKELLTNGNKIYVCYVYFPFLYQNQLNIRYKWHTNYKTKIISNGCITIHRDIHYITNMQLTI